MALHRNFPDDPQAFLDPAIRRFPADEALRVSSRKGQPLKTIRPKRIASDFRLISNFCETFAINALSVVDSLPSDRAPQGCAQPADCSMASFQSGQPGAVGQPCPTGHVQLVQLDWTAIGLREQSCPTARQVVLRCEFAPRGKIAQIGQIETGCGGMARGTALSRCPVPDVLVDGTATLSKSYQH